MHSDPDSCTLTPCPLLQVYEEVVENPYEETGGDDVTALTGVSNEHFPDMRTWIKEHLSMAAEEVRGEGRGERGEGRGERGEGRGERGEGRGERGEGRGERGEGRGERERGEGRGERGEGRGERGEGRGRGWWRWRGGEGVMEGGGGGGGRG